MKVFGVSFFTVVLIVLAFWLGTKNPNGITQLVGRFTGA